MMPRYLNPIFILSYALTLLPIRFQLFLGDCLGWVWFEVLRIRRKTALDNLRKCFPDWTEEERIQMAKASVCHIGRSAIELLRIPTIFNAKYKNHFFLHGREHLDSALTKGKGVFILTAHVGSGDWANAGLAINGYQTHIITKNIKWQWLNKFWFETRSQLGTTLIPDRGSSLTILKALKNNQMVVFVLDQFMGPPIGVKTQFFGMETGSAMGLALLADRSEAAVVPVYTYRDKDLRTHIVCEPEIPFVKETKKEDTIQKMTQVYCDKIETWVRKHPDQWMWVHRRWKRFKV